MKSVYHFSVLLIIGLHVCNIVLTSYFTSACFAIRFPLKRRLGEFSFSSRNSPWVVYANDVTAEFPLSSRAIWKNRAGCSTINSYPIVRELRRKQGFSFGIIFKNGECSFFDLKRLNVRPERCLFFVISGSLQFLLPPYSLIFNFTSSTAQSTFSYRS